MKILHLNLRPLNDNAPLLVIDDVEEKMLSYACLRKQIDDEMKMKPKKKPCK